MRKPSRLGGVAGAALVAILTAGVASGSIPSRDGGLISGCYSKANGALRVIDTEAGESCLRSELAVSWNEQGPQGEPGLPGPKGEKGDPGEPGRRARRAIPATSPSPARHAPRGRSLPASTPAAYSSAKARAS